MFKTIHRPLFLAAMITMALTSPNSNASPLSMAVILNEAESAAEDLIEKGFDRLDQSIIQAGFELRAAVHAARTQYERSLDKTIDKLDQQQRKVVNDISALTRDLENFENKQIKDVLETQEEAVGALYAVISGRPLIQTPMSRCVSLLLVLACKVSSRKMLVSVLSEIPAQQILK